MGILYEEAFVEEGRDGRIKTRQHSKLWLWKLQSHIELFIISLLQKSSRILQSEKEAWKC